MSLYRNIVALYSFLSDLISQKFNINFINRNSSYQLMRFLYRISNGFLTNIICYFISGTKYKNSNKFKKSFKELEAIKLSEIDILISEIKKMRVYDSRMIDYYNKNIFIDETVKYVNSFERLCQENIVRIDVYKSDLLSNKIVTNFVLNERWSEIAKEILGVEPRLINITSWYTLKHKKEINLENYSAQIGHRDVDKLRDIKIFIYLSDVNSLDDGPFEVLIDTHKFDFNFKNYDNNNNFRISDEKIKNKNSYDKHSFLGRRGTSFAVDTRCFHRGGIVKKDYRHVIELYFSNSTFGKHEYLNNFTKPKLNKFWDSYDIWELAIKKNATKYSSLFLGKS